MRRSPTTPAQDSICSTRTLSVADTNTRTSTVPFAALQETFLNLGKYTLASATHLANNLVSPIMMVLLYIYVLVALRAKASCAHLLKGAVHTNALAVADSGGVSPMERNAISQCLAFCTLTTLCAWLYVFPQIIDFHNVFGFSHKDLVNYHLVATFMWQINHGNVRKYNTKSEYSPQQVATRSLCSR